MKKILLLILLVIPTLTSGQAISRLIKTLVSPVVGQPQNIIFVDTLPGQQNRMKVSTLANLKSSLAPIVTSIGIASSNLTVTGSPVTSSGNITVDMPNTGTPGTYNRVTTDALGRVTSGAVDSTYVITRTLNSNFTISTTRSTFVVYSIQSLSNAGNTASAFLEYSVDAVTWIEASRVSNLSNGVGNTQIAILVGRIPANYFVRIRTAGGGTSTFISGQETQL